MFAPVSGARGPEAAAASTHDNCIHGPGYTAASHPSLRHVYVLRRTTFFCRRLQSANVSARLYAASTSTACCQCCEAVHSCACAAGAIWCCELLSRTRATGEHEVGRSVLTTRAVIGFHAPRRMRVFGTASDHDLSDSAYGRIGAAQHAYNPAVFMGSQAACVTQECAKAATRRVQPISCVRCIY